MKDVIMIGKETTLEYLLLHILPVTISGFVTIFCFWLGVFWGKQKERRKKETEIIKHKESIVLSLWEVGIYAEKNKEDVSKYNIEQKGNSLNIDKYYLLSSFPIDFYTIAKSSIMFDFDYELKSDLLLLKTCVEDANKLISIHNDFPLSLQGTTDFLNKIKHNKEQIIKACVNIRNIYEEIIKKNGGLVVPILKNIGKLDEMRSKINKIEKIETLELLEPKFKAGDLGTS